MECITEAFNSSFHVSLDETDVNLIHPRYNQYKQKNSKSSQEERRKLWLLEQKEKRAELFNASRRLPETEGSKPESRHKKKFKNAIMLSEWLVDVPEDISSNWIIKICPEGKRVLVVAERGRTAAFGRSGRLVWSFKSVLPGGIKGSTSKTLLDCIWLPESKVFHILDVIFWGCSLLNCEAQFRFYWLTSKLEENPDLKTSGKENWHVFKEVQPCVNLEEALSIHPFYENNSPKVDGILFYHKEGLYSSGERSPLVTWLKPFMIPNILQIPVNPLYSSEIPPQYQKMDTSEEREKDQNGHEMAT